MENIKNEQYWNDSYNSIINTFHNNLKQNTNQADFIKRGLTEELSDSLFDRFYEQAKIYATNVPDTDNLHDMYTSLQMETILSIKWFIISILNVEYIKNSNITDDSVFRRFLEQYRKVITILLSKPKFTRLLYSSLESSQNQIKIQINQSLQIFQNILQQRALSSSIKKGEVLNSIQSTIEFINYFINNNIIQQSDIIRFFQINISPIIYFGCSLENSQVYRQMAFNILESLPNTNDFKIGILKLLSQIANDQYSLDFYWKFNGIYDQSLILLLNRIPASLSNDLPRNILITISNALKSKYIELSDNNIKLIFQFIDYFIQKKLVNPEREDNESLSVPYEIIDLLSEMIKHLPDNKDILSRVLGYGTNEESLSILLNNSKRFSKSTWIHCLLPFLKSRIQLMKLNGVSGIQAEQTVIECVRECARLFYLDSLKSISYEDSHELAYQLFLTITEAIRHGYQETERFSVVCSIIITNHLPHSIEWFQEILNPVICNSHKTSRAIFDIFLQLLGFTEIEESTTLSTLKGENINRVIHQIVLLKNHIAFSLISTCLKCRSGKRFLSDNPYFVNILIQSIKEVVIESLNREEFLSIDQSESITECIKNLTSVVHPFDAPILFNLALQTLSMTPPSFSSAFGDESLSHMIDKVSDDVPLCMSDIELGLKLGGSETKYSLCSFVPHFCLKDKDPYIRCQALRALEKREDLICQYFRDIIESTSNLPNDSIYELEIMISASPLMPMIVSIERSLTVECLCILYKAIRLSSLSDPQNQPDARPVQYLSQIMEDISVNDLIPLLKNSKLLSIVVKLRKYSLKLKSSLRELSKRGIIQKTKNHQTYAILNNIETSQGLNTAASLLFEQSKLLENSNVHKSIQILIKLNNEHKEFYDSVVLCYLQDPFLKKILRNNFTEISSKSVNESHLELVKEQQKLYRELLHLFNGKEILESQRTQIELILSKNKSIVVLEYFLQMKRDPTSARLWLKENQIRDQLLFLTIDKYENNILSFSLNTEYLNLQERSLVQNSNNDKYIIKPNIYGESLAVFLKQHKQQQQENNLNKNNFDYKVPTAPQIINNNNIKQVEYEMKNLNMEDSIIDDQQDNFDEIETYNPQKEESNWKKILSFQGKQNVEMTPLISNSSSSSQKKSKKGLLLSS